MPNPLQVLATFASLTCSKLMRDAGLQHSPHSACACPAVLFLQVLLLLVPTQGLQRHHRSQASVMAC
jgi:hypothetical protein